MSFSVSALNFYLLSTPSYPRTPSSSRSFCRDRSGSRFAHRLPGPCGGSSFGHTAAPALLHFGGRRPTYCVASTMSHLNHMRGLGLSKALPTHTALISLSDFLGSPLHQNSRQSPQTKPRVPHHKLHVCAAAVQGEIAAHCSRPCTILHLRICSVGVDCWPPFSSCLMLCCRDSTSIATWQAQAEQAFHSK